MGKTENSEIFLHFNSIISVMLSSGFKNES